MTVFITRCWRNLPRLPQRRPTLERALWSVLVCCCLLFGATTAALAQSTSSNAEITQLKLERSDEGVLLTTHVAFDLPPLVDDALAKGIPMFFVAEAVLFRDRWYWYDKQVASVARHMRLSYQPLTRRWRLVVSPSPIGNSGLALGQTFDTREDALAAVQHISRWKIAEAVDVDPESRYNVDFKFRLDVSQLPRPFQIGAVGHGDWNISAVRNQRLAFESPK